MTAALHGSDGYVRRFSNHKLAGVSDGGGTRKRRDVRVRNAHGIGEVVGEGAEAGAENESDFRAQGGL